MALRFRFAQKLLGENTGLRLVSKRGCVVKKHLQARLRGSFPQQIQHSRSESTLCFLSLFDSFAPTHLALRANLRLLLIRASLRRLTLRAALASLPRGRTAAWVRAPATVLGCGSKVSLLFVSICVIGG